MRYLLSLLLLLSSLSLAFAQTPSPPQAPQPAARPAPPTLSKPSVSPQASPQGESKTKAQKQEKKVEGVGVKPVPVESKALVVVLFERGVAILESVVFFDLFGFPLIVLVLVSGSIFFTFRLGFLNLFGFKHAIDIVRGRYDNPEDEGEISHFQALTAALSATVGLGNIAGVAVAVATGGPGAVFWMIFIAFFGMSAKFVECTMAQAYRKVKDGKVSGGPMYYLSEGLEKKGYSFLPKILSIFFAICIIGGAFGGGNMFQSNQAFEIVSTQFPQLRGNGSSFFFGIFLAVLVGLVIIGGIKSIGRVTSKVVPFMVVLYVFASLFVILSHAGRVPALLVEIVQSAFQGHALFGGFLGAMVAGFRRAAFSNEAGIGSAAIAHSAAKTDQPVREGFVALLEPFIDTIVICSMTALVILITRPENTSLQRLRAAQEMQLQAKHTLDKLAAQRRAIPSSEKTKRAAMLTLEKNAKTTLQHAEKYTKTLLRGTEITSRAFESVFPWFSWILALSVFLFAFSTMISWSYYGEKGWEFLFGDGSILLYRLLFLGAVILGCVANLGAVIDFSDMMILLCALPNIIGLVLMQDEVKSRVEDYWKRLKNNEFQEYK